jgi:hypothetical protein
MVAQKRDSIVSIMLRTVYINRIMLGFKEWMEILDGKRHDKAALPHHLSLAVFFLNGGGHWGMLDWGMLNAPQKSEDVKRGDAVFLKTFRALVNQWIDSGKDGEGIESPLRRNVNEVPGGYEVPLYEVMLGWLNRNLPKPALMRNGKIAILAQSPKLWTTDDRNLVKYRDPEEYARECAIFQFKELLELPGANRLACCNNPRCGRYYLRIRLRKKEIKRGAYCGKCVAIGAVERTKISRNARKQELIELAANVWPPDWKPTPKFRNQFDLGCRGNEKEETLRADHAQVGQPEPASNRDGRRPNINPLIPFMCGYPATLASFQLSMIAYQ